MTIAQSDDLAAIGECILCTDTPSDAFRSAYACLETMPGFQEARDAINDDGGIPAHVRIEDPDSEALTNILLGILQLTCMQHSIQTSTAIDNRSDLQGRKRLFVHDMSYTNTPQAVVDMTGLEYLKRIVQLGVHIHDWLPLTNSHSDLSYERRRRVLDALQVLIPTSQSSHSPQHGVDSLVISDQASPEFTPAVLSALRVNRSIDSVELSMHRFGHTENEMGPEDRKALWQWTAYSVFSHHSTHEIKQLEFCVPNLQLADIEAMRAVLTAEDPLAALFNGCHSGAKASRVRASQFFIVDPMTTVRVGEGQVWTSPHPINVDVISSAGQHWKVLLPGLGQAWVRDEDAERSLVHTEQPPKEANNKRSIPHITVEIVVEEILGPLESFFRLVGAGVKSIELQVDVEELHDDWTTNLLVACPDLEKLDLSSDRLANLHVFTDCAMQSISHLKTLKVAHAVTTEGDVDAVCEFLSVLGVASHPFATHLEELQLVLDCQPSGNDRWIAAVQQMLQHNHRLHTLHLALRGLDSSPSAAMAIERTFAEQLANSVRFVPMDMPSKLGFLSAITRSIQEGNAISFLDASIATNIMQFGGHCCPQSVHLSIW